MEEFNLKGDYIELIKLLKASGLCSSGGEAKILVGEGLVIVNGERESRKRRKLIQGDVIELEGMKIKISK